MIKTEHPIGSRTQNNQPNDPVPADVQIAKPDWYRKTAAYCSSDNQKALWQLLNTLLPYCALWWLMVATQKREWPCTLTLLLSIPAAGFMVRILDQFHDCCHGSFFRSQRANSIV